MDKQLQIVGLRIGRETLGLPISLVREIVRVPEITPVPNAPDHIEGVINLRGKIIAVVDLSKRFGEAAIERTSIGVTHGLFGPKLQPGGGGFRPFVTLKGGFVNFRLSPSLLPYSNLASTILGLRTSNLNAAIYPAAGVEAALGPIGLRLEAGDEIYFNQGAQNNLRITFGPILRF